MIKKELIIDVIIGIIIVLFLESFSYTKLLDKSSMPVYGSGILLMVITFIAPFILPIEKGPLDKIVFFFIFSMIISAFTAYIYWDQPLLISLVGYKFFYIYFLYFIFIIFGVTAERVERIMLLLFFFSVGVFLIDRVTFPDPLFSYRNEERRNGITIFFYGQGFTFLGAFYFLNKFLKEKKISYLGLFIVAALCLFLLTQSRMNLLALTLGFFLMFIFSDFKNKYLVTALIIVAGGIFYATSSAFDGVKEASRDQSQFYKEDIRVLAYNYFLTDFQGGPLTMLFGNGFPASHSRLELESIKGNLLGFWTADVGLLGIYSYFGLLGVIAWLLFFYAVFTLKKPGALYIKAYFFTLLTTTFSGYSIFDPGYMPATVLALYLLRCEAYKEDTAEEADDIEEDADGIEEDADGLKDEKLLHANN